MTDRERNKFFLDHNIKFCPDCDEYKDLSEFPKNHDGFYQNRCCYHYNIYQKERYKLRVKNKIIDLWKKK